MRRGIIIYISSSILEKKHCDRSLYSECAYNSFECLNIGIPSPAPDKDVITSNPDFEILSTLVSSAAQSKLPNYPETSASLPLANCSLLQYAIDCIHAATVEFGWPAVIANFEQEGRVESLAAIDYW